MPEAPGPGLNMQVAQKGFRFIVVGLIVMREEKESRLTDSLFL